MEEDELIVFSCLYHIFREISLGIESVSSSYLDLKEIINRTNLKSEYCKIFPNSKFSKYFIFSKPLMPWETLDGWLKFLAIIKNHWT